MGSSGSGHLHIRHQDARPLLQSSFLVPSSQVLDDETGRQVLDIEESGLLLPQ